MLATVHRKERIVYPVRDEEPLGETDLHAQETIALFNVLKLHFTAAGDVYVAADNFVYFVEGKPKICVSPDVYVVFGVEKKLRDCYMVWEEGGHVPNVVFEVTSRSSRAYDLGKKRSRCRRFGVQEYFLFDPKQEYLHP